METRRKKERRIELIQAFARKVVANVDRPELCGGKYIELPDGRRMNRDMFRLQRWPETGEFTKRQASALAAIVKIRPGLDAGRMKTALEKDDLNPLINLVPWRLEPGEFPEVAFDQVGDKRNLVLIAPWPDDLKMDSIPVTSLPKLARSGEKTGRWIAGPNLYGDYVTPMFSNVYEDRYMIHHMITGGLTGRGKSELMKSIGYQLSGDHARIVLIDMKHEEGVGSLNGIPGQVGPVVSDIKGARRALFWVWQQVVERFKQKKNHGAYEGVPIYVFIDEFGKATCDKAIEWMLYIIATQGRAVGVRIIGSEQKPYAGSYGHTKELAGAIKQQLQKAVVCFETYDEQDTKMILPPHTGLRPYMTLTRPGDGYLVINSVIHRVMFAYVPGADLKAKIESNLSGFTFPRWPQFDVSQIDQLDDSSAEYNEYSIDQLAVAVASDHSDLNRKKTRELLVEHTGSGISNSKYSDLRRAGQDLEYKLQQLGYRIEKASSVRPSGPEMGVKLPEMSLETAQTG
jgi:hypothetical protein